ncbi:unnamed protein product [Clavelina lepadiformis]|uniref:prostaglandin-endoperoxide synthase n=1 Tax=Clavelina lepadiformis TaxID=159417 RepID=A0ABP0GWQ1_CLALP
MELRLLSVIFVLFYTISTSSASYNPCCSLPCQNGGVCVPRTADEYKCYCDGTGYFGKNCDNVPWMTKITNMFRPSKSFMTVALTHVKFVWIIVNNITWLSKYLMKNVLKLRTGIIPEPTPFKALDTYPTWDTYANNSVYSRTLPAIPKNCPKPMGTIGPDNLPDPDMLVKNFFTRSKFEPCPVRTSVMFPFFAQHFTHQFFKTDIQHGMPYQWGDNAVDLSHVYGNTQERQKTLRLMKDGKLKYSVINGEMFPPHIKDANVTMFGIDKVPKGYDFAIGHPGFAVMPTFLFFSTLWLREHNRVCDVLKEENPFWDDERLFQTARLILTGETIKVVIEDYVQHLSGFHYQLIYDPTIMHDEGFSYHNQIHVEFVLLYHWHALMPDNIRVNDHAYAIRNLLFNPKPFVDAGMAAMVKELSTQFAGRAAGGKSQGYSTRDVSKWAIIDSRNMRLQPFNKYRVKFGMKPYKSFEEFTGETEMAAELEKLYGHIDALEYFVGMILEKRRHPQVFGETLTEIGSPYSLKGLIGNPVSSPDWWKPSTFGGDKGMNIIKTTNLQELVCRNVEGCPDISFKVRDDIDFEPIESNLNPKDDHSSQILLNIIEGVPVEDGVIDGRSSFKKPPTSGGKTSTKDSKSEL